jgi:hypothetical protein
LKGEHKKGKVLLFFFKMEGACGKILSTDDPLVVIKKVYRRNRPQQRICSLRAEEQARMQEWARMLCVSLRLPLLFVPRAWEAEKYQYKMSRIDVSKPLSESDYKTHPVLADLKSFYTKTKELGVYPADYELYLQPDGRVAMVDFDKFARWNQDGSVEFPWGLTVPSKQIEDTLTYILD